MARWLMHHHSIIMFYIKSYFPGKRPVIALGETSGPSQNPNMYHDFILVYLVIRNHVTGKQWFSSQGDFSIVFSNTTVSKRLIGDLVCIG